MKKAEIKYRTNSQFSQMKERGEYELGRLQAHIKGFDVGAWKKKTLNKILGRRGRTVLQNDEVNKRHRERLSKQFLDRWAGLKKQEVNDRLRQLTLLHDVVYSDLEDIQASVENLEQELDWVLKHSKGAKGIEVIGAIEIEIINLEIFERVAATDEEGRRKHSVILNIREKTKVPSRKVLEKAIEPPSRLMVFDHAARSMG